jgi:hypothetical protein
VAEEAKDWAIVFSGGNKFVGKVVDTREDWVTLKPCLEYISELQAQQGPGGQIAIAGRTRILLPFDHTMAPCPVEIRTDVICRLDGLSENEQKGFMNQIDSALEKMTQAKLQAESNLVMANQMPTGPLPGGQA